MAGLLLSAAGAAVGGAIGGTVLGISSAVIGQAVGAVVGSAIDSYLFAPTIRSNQEGPRLKENQIMTSSEGIPIPRAYGQVKVSGNLIWATRFLEVVTQETTTSGGKGAGGGGQSVTTTTYNYYANFAVALCEGVIDSVDRVWADGNLLNMNNVNYRVHVGNEGQLPDGLMEQKDGEGNIPGYRGVAYIVFQNLPINEYGNRIPQLAFRITKRVDGRAYAPLDSLLEELADYHGITTACDFSALSEESFDGYLLEGRLSFRSSVEPLSSLFRFNIIESGESFKAVNRYGLPALAYLTGDDLAESEQDPLVLTRSAMAETPQGLTLRYIDSGKDYEAAAVSKFRGVVDYGSLPATDVPIVTDLANAQRIVDHMLYDAWSQRTTGSFGLMPSYMALEPGDAVRVVEGGFDVTLRIESIADGDYRMIEARSFTGSIRQGVDDIDRVYNPDEVVTPVEPTVLFMDLPILGDSADPGRPYIASYSNPWSGVNIYRSVTDSNFSLDAQVAVPAVIGETTQPFSRGPLGLWDRTTELYVELLSGHLTSLPEVDVLEGSNTLAIENSTGGWEVVQFATAELVGVGTYKLTDLLRGQLGTEDGIEDTLAAGARVVLLQASTLAQLPLPLDGINRSYYLRYGPSSIDIGDPLYSTESKAFTGRGLRPLSPCHLRATTDGADNTTLEWIRRTRINGDNWEYLGDVSLGEAFEKYEVDVISGGSVVRTLAVTDATSVVYTGANKVADGVSGSFDMEVYQLSDLVGRGIGRRITVNG